MSPAKNAVLTLVLATGLAAPAIHALAANEPRPGTIAVPTDPIQTHQQALKAPSPDAFSPKSRVFVLTDIGNEPDDQMSFVRLLVYANEIDIEGAAAVTSTWLRNKTNPETLHKLIDAYAEALPNLQEHATGWPSADTLHDAVSIGPPAYGLAAVNTAEPSSAARALIAAVDRADDRPLWVSIWGGANVLAEALEVVRRSRTPDALAIFVGSLRVYSISDQDDAGPWIRREFPALQYVVSPSLPTSDNYAAATWSGISGDVAYANGEGADGSTVTNEWLDTHIRQGPLGALYPKFIYIMEGDTPAFLGLIPNGLNSAISPAWGGWGGRYVYLRPYGESRPIWTQGGAIFYGANSRDRVTGIDGQSHVSDQATIWRWRSAFQNDFAARMRWTLPSQVGVNRRPAAVVNGDRSDGPLFINLKVGTPLVLDASQSDDPDARQTLRFRWFLYPEAAASLGMPLADVTIDGADSARATLSAASACRPPMPNFKPRCKSGTAHVILEVSDDGQPSLTSYRRVVVMVQQ